VKTFVPGIRTVSVGRKAEKDNGSNFVWVLAGIPVPNTDKPFEYFIIPSEVVSRNVREAHQNWLSSPGKKGHVHKDSNVRAIDLPPRTSSLGWDISPYRNRWEIIEQLLR
jgi:hypothetical protein